MRAAWSQLKKGVAEPHPELCPTWHILSSASAALLGTHGTATPSTSANRNGNFMEILSGQIHSMYSKPVQFSRRSPALCFPSWGSAESNMKTIQGRDNTAQPLAKPLQLLITQNFFDFLSSAGSSSKAWSLFLAQLQMQTSFFFLFPRIHSIESSFESSAE